MFPPGLYMALIMSGCGLLEVVTPKAIAWTMTKSKVRQPRQAIGLYLLLWLVIGTPHFVGGGTAVGSRAHIF